MMTRAHVVLVASLAGSAAFATAAALLTACVVPTVPSSSVTTSSLRVYYQVDVTTVSSPPKTTLWASYYSGVSPVLLAQGDALTASTDKDANVVLAPSGTNYEAHFPVLDRTAFTFTLTRAGGLASTSTLTLAPLSAITSPTPKQELSYASGSAVITWSNPVPGARVYAFAGPCGGVQLGNTPEVDDTGTYSLPMTKVLLGGKPAAPKCTNLFLTRTTKGTVDPAFAAGSKIEAVTTVIIRDVMVGP